MRALSFWRLGGLLGFVMLAAACGAASTPHAQVSAPRSEPATPSFSDADVQAVLGPSTRYAVSIDGIPCEGPADALVTIVEFSGYECPFTRRLEPTVRRVLAEHSGDIRFCVRQFPNPAQQPHGLLAAHVALEAFRQGGSETFFRLHRALLDSDPLSDDAIFASAIEVGLDETALHQSLAANVHAPELEADRAQLRRLDRNGTPELYVDGRLLPGARPYEEVASAVDEAVIDARRLVELGVPRELLYATVQRTALTDVAPEPPRPGEPERVRIRFIDVATSAHPLATESRTLEEARALAERLATDLRGGADFHALATQYSAAGNAAQGGEFGWIARGTLTEDTADVAFALDVGAIGVTCGDSELACRIIQRLE
jgi:protein-disulfide isomerase